MHTQCKRFILLVVASTALPCSASFALGDASGSPANVPHVTPALSATLHAAQDALQAKPPKLQEAVAKLKEAEANPEKSAYDEHIIAVLAGSAYARLGDYPDAEQAFEAQIDDSFTRPDDRSRILKAVTQLNYELKDYARTAQFGNLALTESVDDGDLYTLVSQAYYLNGQDEAVREFLGKRVESLDRQGRDVPQQYLQLIVSSCTRLQDNACVTTNSRRLNAPGSPNAPRKPLLIDPELKHDPTLQANAGGQ